MTDSQFRTFFQSRNHTSWPGTQQGMKYEYTLEQLMETVADFLDEIAAASQRD